MFIDSGLFVPTFPAFSPRSQIESKNANFSGLQSGIQKLTTSLTNKTPATHAATVALNAATGEVLGMASKSDLKLKNLHLQNFPAASLAKIITALYLLEAGVTMDQEVSYPARYQLSPNYSSVNNRETLNPFSTNLQNAFAYSNSLAIAKFLWQTPGTAEEKLNHYLQIAYRAGYNQSSASDFKIEKPVIYDAPLRGGSEAKQLLKLGRLACGFQSSYTNCLHQARFFAAVITNGQLPAIHLSVNGSKHTLQSQFSGIAISTPEVLKNLRSMLAAVTACGTAQKRSAGMFSTDPKQPVLAKTGTLLGHRADSFYHPDSISTFEGLKQWTVAEHQGIVVASLTCQPYEGYKGVAQELCFQTLKMITANK